MDTTNAATGTTTSEAHRSGVALTAARVVAGVVAALQLVGVGYFVIISPADAVWLGAGIDVPVTGLLVLAILLKLAFALRPGLDAAARIRLGAVAVGASIAVTLLKIPLYNEPESAVFLAVDALVAALLAGAWRTGRAAR